MLVKISLHVSTNSSGLVAVIAHSNKLSLHASWQKNAAYKHVKYFIGEGSFQHRLSVSLSP